MMNSDPTTTTGRTPAVDDSVERRIEQVFGEAPQRRNHRRKVVAAVTAAAVLVAGVGVASATGGNGDAELRTAVAEITDVAARLEAVATIEPVSAASVAFPADGTVASVEVDVGDQVTAGQALATLDETELERTLHERTEALARAELALSQALDGENPDGERSSVEPVSTGATSGTISGIATSTGTSSGAAEGVSSVQYALLTTDSSGGASGEAATGVATAATGPSAAAAGSDAELAQLQQAVLDAQSEVSASLLAGEAALEASETVCDLSGLTDAAAASGDGAVGDVTSDADADPTSEIDACRSALAAVQEAQTATAAAQAQLVDASNALDTYLADLAASSPGDSGGSDGTGGSDQGSGSADDSGGAGDGSSGAQPGDGGTDVLGGSDSLAGSGSQASSGSASSSPSAAELVAYQKAVDAAQLEVLVAVQALARSAIVSPIAGTVTSIGFEVGDDVSAASATQIVAISGDEGLEVVTTVALSEVASVELGQPAQVVPDGSQEALDGEVVGVSPVPESDSTNYRITIGLADPAVDVRNGTTGTVEITTADARDALAVPSSAVRLTAEGGTVTVERGGSTEEVRVALGVTGSDWIEVTSGLEEGDVVVLADLSEELPGADASQSDDADATADANGIPEGFGPGAAGGRPGG